MKRLDIKRHVLYICCLLTGLVDKLKQQQQQQELLGTTEDFDADSASAATSVSAGDDGDDSSVPVFEVSSESEAGGDDPATPTDTEGDSGVASTGAPPPRRSGAAARGSKGCVCSGSSFVLETFNHKSVSLSLSLSLSLTLSVCLCSVCVCVCQSLSLWSVCVFLSSSVSHSLYCFWKIVTSPIAMIELFCCVVTCLGSLQGPMGVGRQWRESASQSRLQGQQHQQNAFAHVQTPQQRDVKTTAQQLPAETRLATSHGVSSQTQRLLFVLDPSQHTPQGAAQN